MASDDSEMKSNGGIWEILKSSECVYFKIVLRIYFIQAW